MSTAWEAQRLAIGTPVRISEEAIIDAVRLPGKEEWISSLYTHSGEAVINSEEAKPYLGQSGIVIEQNFSHAPHVQVADGAVVVVMYRSGVMEL